jgi:ABC-type Fe3+-hydroxamate transport system substrate-binding protein
LYLLDAPVLQSRSVTVALAMLTGVAVGGCRERATPHASLPSQTAASPATLELRDDFGRVTRLATIPTRIVSLNPATTELLFAIGAGARVVGRTQYDNWPDSAKLVPSVGQGIRPNLEAVLARDPDLVILYASDADRGTADRLAAAGVPAIALRDDHIRDLERVTMILGRIVGDTVRARTVVDSVTATLDRVRRATAPLPHPTVFIHAWEKPLMTLGGGSFISELISIAGARNIYDSLPAPSPSVAIEDVVRRNPDFILVSPGEERNILATPRWRSLPAVRAGRIVAFDTNLVARPAVKLGEAAVSLAKLFHPELHLDR